MSQLLFSGPEWSQFKGSDEKVELLLFCMDPKGRLFPEIVMQLQKAAAVPVETQAQTVPVTPTLSTEIGETCYVA
jgi:hypothetical protein